MSSSTKETTTAATSSLAPPSSSARSRRARRRSSAAPRNKPAVKLNICKPLPLTLEALDLPSASPVETLATLRFLVLSYLAHLEEQLTNTDSPSSDEDAKDVTEVESDDGAQWARAALQILEEIRDDVCSHLPEFPHVADISRMEEFVKSHLPELPIVPGFDEMRSHLPDMAEMRTHLPDIPHLPDMPDMRSHFSEMRTKFDDVRSRFHDMDLLKTPLSYVPTLSDHMNNLHSHLSSVDSGNPPMTPRVVISDFLDALVSSDLVQDLINNGSEEITRAEEAIEQAARDVADAVRHSLQGVKLIQYSDLPEAWKNNPFVTHGYRFIPIEKWPLIIMSLFALHNETLNIHTHLVPFLLWGWQCLSSFGSNYHIDTPERLFMCFALLCLFTSALWHTMAGCAHHKSMDLCARIDYIGIGWLISASVGTVVWYGYQCHPNMCYFFLACCFATGLAGNIFPFMDWFNDKDYRHIRIMFFLGMAFSAIAPLAGIAFLYSTREMANFMAPVVPSLVSYLIGLTFYALHFPERILPPSIQGWLDCVGGGSHCIWHCFIVLAVSQHRAAIPYMREHMICAA